MLILSRVCAEFYDKHNNLLGRITPRDLGTFREISDRMKRRIKPWSRIPLPERRRKGRRLSPRLPPNRRMLPM